MGAGGDLGHDAAEAGVQVGLRGDDVGQDGGSSVKTAAAVSSQEVSMARKSVSFVEPFARSRYLLDPIDPVAE